MNLGFMRVAERKHKPCDKLCVFSKVSAGEVEATSFSASAIRITQLLDAALSLFIFTLLYTI